MLTIVQTNNSLKTVYKLKLRISNVLIEQKTSLRSATTYADNLALPAFARRTPLLQVCCCEPVLRQTDRRTDGRTP